MELFLDSLFRVSELVELPGKVVTVRALGDAELRLREQMSRTHAGKFRKLLQDETSLEYETYVAPLLEMEEHDLRETLVSFYNALEAEQEARENIKPRFVPEPDDSTLDEKLETDEAQKEADKAYQEALRREVEGLSEIHRQGFANLSKEQLANEVKTKAVSYFAYGEYLRFTVLASLYLATEFQGKRAFQTTSDVDNLPRELVLKLQDAFAIVNNKDIWELSKESLKGN